MGKGRNGCKKLLQRAVNNTVYKTTSLDKDSKAELFKLIRQCDPERAAHVIISELSTRVPKSELTPIYSALRLLKEKNPPKSATGSGQARSSFQSSQ